MKTLTTLLMGTGALLASSGLASGGRLHHPVPTSAGARTYAHQIVRSSRYATLYDQTSSDSGIGIVSQNFESSFDAYDSQGADDFHVPAGAIWQLREVDVAGVYFNGYGLAVSENVFIYKNKKGRPGALIREFTVAGQDSGTGSFIIPLPKNKGLKGGINGATYWISVQINMDFNAGGEWGWENQSTSEGFPAQWQNPGGGFGLKAIWEEPGNGTTVDCTTWAQENICIADGQGDHMFALKGKTKGG